jgi:hypothetical protein
LMEHTVVLGENHRPAATHARNVTLSKHKGHKHKCLVQGCVFDLSFGSFRKDCDPQR